MHALALNSSTDYLKVKAEHTSLDQGLQKLSRTQRVPPASPRHPLISDTSQTGTSFQIAGTANSWTIPVLMYWYARKQRGSISAHRGCLYLNVTYHYGIKMISYVHMRFYVLLISKGYSANMLPWAIWHRSRFPPVTTRRLAAPLLPGMLATEAVWNPSPGWEGSPWPARGEEQFSRSVHRDTSGPDTAPLWLLTPVFCSYFTARTQASCFPRTGKAYSFLVRKMLLESNILQVP